MYLRLACIIPFFCEAKGVKFKGPLDRVKKNCTLIKLFNWASTKDLL